MKKILLSIVLLSSLSVTASELTSGEIRRIDVDNKKVTIKHQEIKNLDMPEMTMVFQVESPAILQGLNAGDNIEFMAILKDKKYFVTTIKKK